MLNGRKLVENKIITGVINEENIAQHGVDLNVIRFSRLVAPGRISKNGKATLPEYEEVKITRKGQRGNTEDEWFLQPGVYLVDFAQGCDIPNGTMLKIVQRSSLLRCGGLLASSLFDAGFKTNGIGSALTINFPVVIEYGARIAQIYDHTADPIEERDLYGAEGKGSQWQGDNQRGAIALEPSTMEPLDLPSN